MTRVDHYDDPDAPSGRQVPGDALAAGRLPLGTAERGTRVASLGARS